MTIDPFQDVSPLIVSETSFPPAVKSSTVEAFWTLVEYNVQRDCLTMDSPLSAILAELFQDIEKQYIIGNNRSS